MHYVKSPIEKFSILMNIKYIYILSGGQRNEIHTLNSMGAVREI